MEVKSAFARLPTITSAISSAVAQALPRQENPNKQLADRLLQQSEAVTAQSFAAITNFAGIFRLQEENRDKVSQRNHDLATPKLRNEITTESLVETRQQLRAVEEAAGAALAAAAEVARTRLFSSLPPY